MLVHIKSGEKIFEIETILENLGHATTVTVKLVVDYSGGITSSCLQA